MANLRTTAQSVLEEAHDGIAWIALFRQGRGWGAECFWPDFDEKSNSFDFEDYDIDSLKEILAIDQNAIFVNSYYINLGPVEGMTRETLAAALRWQYEGQYSRLAEAWQEPDPAVQKGDAA